MNKYTTVIIVSLLILVAVFGYLIWDMGKQITVLIIGDNPRIIELGQEVDECNLQTKIENAQREGVAIALSKCWQREFKY